MKKKKRRKRRKKIRKVFVSTAAFVIAVFVIVFCIYNVVVKTDFFNVKGIDISGNRIYAQSYIQEKSGIKLGEKIFNIDKKLVKENLEAEIYIQSARIVYELPDRIYIETIEREEKYQIHSNNEYIVTDNEGVVLNIYNEKSKLLTIESLVNVIYNVGEKIKFDGIEDVDTIFELMEYSKVAFNKDTIRTVSILNGGNILLDTEYGAGIKLSLTQDIKYQLNFAYSVIKNRLDNNLDVTNDLIDFTKADNPVYGVDDYQSEGIKNE